MIPFEGHKFAYFERLLRLINLLERSPSTADDDNKLYAPLLTEIKEGQWLGVTVSSQRPSGVVSLIQHTLISFVVE